MNLLDEFELKQPIQQNELTQDLNPKESTIKTAILLIIMCIWCFGSGVVVGRLVFPLEIVENRNFHVLEPLQEEIHIVAVSKEEPIRFFSAYSVDRKGLENIEPDRKYAKAFMISYRSDSGEYGRWVEDSFEEINLVQNSGEDNLSKRLNQTYKLSEYEVKLNISELQTLMPIRSESLYSKFAGFVDGELLITSNLTGITQEVPAYIAISQGFNDYQYDLSIFEQGIETNWAMFFDATGNFYHLDDTKVSVPTETYGSHMFYGRILNTPSRFELITEGLNVAFDEEFVFIESNANADFEFELGPAFEPQTQYRYYPIMNSNGAKGMFLRIDTNQ